MTENAKRTRQRTTTFGRSLTVRLDEQTWAALEAMRTAMDEQREPSAKPTTWSQVLRLVVLEGATGVRQATERAAVDPAALARLDELADQVAAAEKQTRMVGYGINALVKTLRTTSQNPNIAALLGNIREELRRTNNQLGRLLNRTYGGAPWR